MYVILLYYIYCTYFERSYIYDTVSIPKTFHETQVRSLLSPSLIWRSPKFTQTNLGTFLPCQHGMSQTLRTLSLQSTISMPPLRGYPWRNMGVYGQGTTCCRVKPARLSNKAPSLAIEIGDWDPTVATCLLLCFLSLPKKGWTYTNRTIYLWAKGWGGSTGVLVTWSWTTYLSSVSVCLPKCQVGS